MHDGRRLINTGGIHDWTIQGYTLVYKRRKGLSIKTFAAIGARNDHPDRAKG
ncbi:hypothetical protein BVG79_01199 [Ketogulonicigenium robustum]|uniref:Uncharacterized protein n=1 Tax=Ketogulonicigenium robustum TaxID=92947 RepID=A0A1W6NZ74_9RHOB|nr:hypothetical protein BVG79_01199 [Ketogulonicigenium robustum]